MPFTMGDIGCTPCCGCSPYTITNQFCGFNLVAFTVNLLSGSTTVATGTTNSSGQVTFSVPSATYTVQLIGQMGLPTQTTTRVISCSGGSGTIGWSNANNLTVTDANGTWTLTYQGSFQWLGCYSEPGSGYGTYAGAAGGDCQGASGTAYDVSYFLSCGSGGPGPGSWELTQTVSFCFEQITHPSVTCFPILCSNGFNSDCSYIAPACPSGVATAPVYTTPTWSLPFTMTIPSGTLATCSGNNLAYPISGTVTIDY